MPKPLPTPYQILRSGQMLGEKHYDLNAPCVGGIVDESPDEWDLCCTHFAPMMFGGKVCLRVYESGGLLHDMLGESRE